MNNDDESETVVARHETMAMMAVHLPRIQNLVVGDGPPIAHAGLPFGRSGRGSQLAAELEATTLNAATTTTRSSRTRRAPVRYRQ